MTHDQILAELASQQQLLANYEELEVDIEDDDAYIARGNGFCDAKYSSDFITEQIDRIKNHIAELQQMLKQ